MKGTGRNCPGTMNKLSTIFKEIELSVLLLPLTMSGYLVVQTIEILHIFSRVVNI